MKKRFVACVSSLFISSSSLSCFSIVSAVLVHPLRHHLSVHSLVVLSRPESVEHTSLRTCIKKLDYPTKSDTNTVYESKKLDKITSVDSDTMLIDDPDLDELSDFSKTSRENTELIDVPTIFESSVCRVSLDDFTLQVENEDSMHREFDY